MDAPSSPTDSNGRPQPPARPEDFLPNRRERLTAPWRALPDLLVIGAQKAGTTSLHDFLGQHPQVRMSRIKECHMLWRADFGLLRYRAYFPLRSRCRAEGVRRIGESTPYYLFHPAAAASAVRLDAAVRAEGRSLKAIAVLRDPAERAWSHYCHGRRLGIESMSFVEALEREDERTRDDPFSHRHHSYRARGLYAEQLARWFAALGRDRVLVLEFGDLLTMDESLRERLRLFLGVDHAFSGRFPGLNAGKGEPMPEDARRLLRRSFEGPDRELAHLLGMRCSWMAPPSPDRPGAT